MRSGHNFIPDWMTRAATDKVADWADRFGSTRVRLRPLWNEMMSDYRDTVLKEITMPESRTFRNDPHPLCA